MAKMTENTRKVFDFLKSVGDANYTAQDVADELGFEKKASVDGAFTSGIQRKGYGVRVEKEIELEDGSHKKVKFLKLTEAGLAYDPDAEEEA